MKKDLGFPPCGKGPGPYVFVSYSHEDQEIVSAVMTILHRHGYRIWYDAGVYVGDRWRDEIARHIWDCGAFFAFHSAASVRSPHCRAELSEALDKEKRIISIYLEDVELPPGDAMYLRPYQSERLDEYETAERFTEERLLDLDGLDVCRRPVHSQGGALTAADPSPIGPIVWELDRFGVLKIERMPAPEGEWKMLISVQSRGRDA